MTRRIGLWIVRVVALVSIAICVLVSAVDIARGLPSGGFYPLDAAIAVVFIVVGWLIAERRTGNVIGPLLVLFGTLFAWYLPADLALHLPDPPPGADLAALFISVLDAPMFIVIALVLIVFPDGALRSPRWRWTIAVAAVGIGSAVAAYTLSGEPFPIYPTYRSPIGIAGIPALGLAYVGYLVMAVLLVSAVAALTVRWRGGNTLERAQIKWVAAAAIVLVVTELINVATFRADQPNALTNILASIGIVCIPIAMGISILRYRLYDIDRVISRSVGYAVVTAILATLFATINLLLQSVLTLFTAGQSVAVAASTLAVFALFQPIRRRVQRAVDQRFDRARYDGERIAAAFSGRLRYETDMETVTTDLAETADSAVAPAALGIWLRSGVGR